MQDYLEMLWIGRVFTGVHGAWILRKLHTLLTIPNDFDSSRFRDAAPFAQLIGEDWYLVPSEADLPDHALLRALINPIFILRRMAALDNWICAVRR